MRLRYGLLALALTCAASASAQEAPAVQAAKGYFRDAQAAGRTAGEPADLAELEAASVHQDARTGITYVHLVQQYEGREVFGTATAAAVLPNGTVRAAADRFQAGLAERVRTTDPVVSAETAAAVAAGLAADAAGRAGRAQAADAPPLLTDDPAVDRRARTQPAGSVETEGGTPRLGYHTLRDGSLRLAWETVASASAPGAAYALRRVRIDAVTGAVLTDDDLVVRDRWPSAPADTAPAARSVVARAEPSPGPRALGAARAGSYRVIPLPFESPIHGEFVLVSDPADPEASPRGWHDDGAQTYTVTRGNNAYAYADADADNAPDAGSAPDGGSGLVFDFAFGPDRSPAANADAAITNLFYWNNTVHDVAYHYGFDEGAGNFQNTNWTGVGTGDDFVLAEALDGAGRDNANFGTPPEGRTPRMQMFRWTGTFELTVTAPERLAGPYPSRLASFGPSTSFEGQLVQTRGPNGETLGCAGQITNDVAGKVALVERGTCTFVEKVTEAQEQGAIAVVVYNQPADPTSPGDSGGEAFVLMGGDGVGVRVPSTFVQRSTGLTLRGESAAVKATALADRDSGLDAGVVAHEYAHGISNRLVGGPLEVGCLTNGATDPENPANNRPGEQMGEGWSDFYGLVLTMQPDDLATQPRGVGTYLQFENPDGRGIRNAPYSTSFTINDYTYADVISNATHTPSGGRALSIPHGVGFVWATALWEMTWELIDAFGFSEDIADADGTAGNQIALNLVTTGLKLTPCTPGFVDGRDAILAADQVLYDGAYAPYIWRAFAQRGLGVDADQGSPEDPNDGTADFVAPEDLQGAVLLSVSEVGTAVSPGASATETVEVVNERDRVQNFSVDAGVLPSWLRVTPAEGSVPAGGRATLTVSIDPSPLATGVLRTTVPVRIGAASRLSLAVSVETDGTFEGTHQLSPVGPNPSRETFRFTLAVAEAQTVRAFLYDALGRRVSATARALEAGTREPFTVSVDGLAAGVYVLQVAGDTFRESRTVTVIR